MKTEKIKVEGMSCSHCENAVNDALSKLDGVKSADASAADKSVTVTFDESAVRIADICLAIEEQGFDVIE